MAHQLLRQLTQGDLLFRRITHHKRFFVQGELEADDLAVFLKFTCLGTQQPLQIFGFGFKALIIADIVFKRFTHIKTVGTGMFTHRGAYYAKLEPAAGTHHAICV